MDAKPTFYRTVFRRVGLVASLILLVLVAVGQPVYGLFWTVGAVYYGCFLGLPFVLTLIVAYHVAVNRRFGRYDAAALAVAALPVATYVYATHIEPNNLQVRRVDIETDEIDGPLRVLHISDIQSDGIEAYERRAFARMKSLDPDLIIHTGDLLQADAAAQRDKLADLFDSLDPKYGVYNVGGDADYGWSADRWRAFDRKAGIRTLHDETVDIATAGGTIHLLGLSVRRSRNLEPETLHRWVEQAAPDSDNLRMVVGHAPEFATVLDDMEVDVALAGHTHGGQIRVPFFGPIITLSSVPRDWARGHTVVGSTHLNVSAGIGAEHASGLPSIRFNCPPEMTLVTLR